MEITAIKCGSCNAPLEVFSESAKVVRCKYCDFVNRINFKGETEVLVDAGASYKSVARTVMKKRVKDFEIGKWMNIDGDKYFITGLLEWQYEGGFWYDFLLRKPEDRLDYYLSYDTEAFILYRFARRSGITKKVIEKMKLGTTIKTERDERIVLEERGTCKIVGFSGEIPFAADEGESRDYYDGYFLDKDDLFTVHVMEDKFTVWFGKEVDI